MKANEAPEKLYLLPNGFISYFRNTDEDIEYTRTNAFIEKACEYLREHIDRQLTIYHEQTWKKRDEDLENAFPELKESEDERIRKAIISGMKSLQEKGKYTEFAHIPMNDVFAWLEKQGEKKSQRMISAEAKED